MESLNTIVKMEEGYMRVSIQYTNREDRPKICDTIGEVEQELGIHPEVLHRREHETLGTFSIEFSGDDYLRDTRASGEFINLLLCKLGINKCDNL
jgi:hypothetical protein